MKISGMKTGVVYAYQASKYDKITPVVLLDTQRLWSRSYGARFSANLHPFSHAHDRIKSASKDVGHLAITVNNGELHRSPSLDLNQVVESIKNLDVSAQTILSATFDQVRTLVPSPLETVVINPRYVLGEWSEIMDQQQATEDIHAALDAEADRESAERVQSTQQRVDALRALSLPGSIATASESAGHRYSIDEWAPKRYSGNTGSVTLTLAQIDALLSLLPQDAKITDSNLDMDGWSYVHPDGVRS